MNGKTSILLLLGMIAVIALGGLLGNLLPEVMLALSFIGEMFIKALSIAVVVIIAAGMTIGIANMGDYRKLGFASGKTLLFYLISGLFAVAIALIVGLVFQPGASHSIPGATAGFAEVTTLVAGYEFYGGLILFSIILGGVLTTTGVKTRPVVTFLKALAETKDKLVLVLFYAAPIGLFSLIGTHVAREEISFGALFEVAGGYPLAAILGILVYIVIGLPIALKFLGQKDILAYFANLVPAIVAAFGTSSSTAALPFTARAVDNSAVDKRAGSLVLPIGTFFNFGPTALVAIIAALFIAQASGITLGAWTTTLIVLAAIVASIGIAGMPGILRPMLLLVLGLSGVPSAMLAGVGVVILADWLIDRLRAVANVCGDAVGAAVIGETFEFKTATRTPARAITKRPGRTSRPLKGRTADKPATRRGSSDDSRKRPQREKPARATGRGTRTPQSHQKMTPPQPKPVEQDSPFAIKDTAMPALDIDSPIQTDTRRRTKDKPTPKQSKSTRSSRPDRTVKDSSRKTHTEETQTAEVQHKKPAPRKTGDKPVRRRSPRGSRKPAGEEATPVASTLPDIAETPVVERPKPPEKKVTEHTQPADVVAKEDAREVEQPVAGSDPSPGTIERELSKISAQLRSMESTPESDSEAVDKSHAPETDIAKPSPTAKAPALDAVPPMPDVEAAPVVDASSQTEPEAPAEEKSSPAPKKRYGTRRTSSRRYKRQPSETKEESVQQPKAEPVVQDIPTEKAEVPVEAKTDIEIPRKEPAPVEVTEPAPAAEEPVEPASDNGTSDEERMVAASFGRSGRRRPKPKPAAKPADSGEADKVEAKPVPPVTEKVTFGRSKRKRTR